MFAKIRATKDENRTFSEPQILDWLIQLVKDNNNSESCNLLSAQPENSA